MAKHNHKTQSPNNNTDPTPESVEKPAPVPPAEAAPDGAERSSGSGTILWIAASAVVAAGLAAGFAEWRNTETRATFEARLAKITAHDDENGRAELAALQDRVARMENLLTNDSASHSAAQTQLRDRLTELGQTADTTRAELGSALTGLSAQLGAESETRKSTDRALSDQIAALGSRISVLEQSHEQRADAVVAAASLARAALGSGSFHSELEAFERASGETLSGMLRMAARTGVPGWPELTARFPEAARKALETDQQPAEGAGPVERATRFLESLVVVRPAGEIAGGTPEARLSQAQARLNEGDPAAALTALEQLPLPIREAMADWIDSARLRLAAETEIDALLHATLGRGS